MLSVIAGKMLNRHTDPASHLWKMWSCWSVEVLFNLHENYYVLNNCKLEYTSYFLVLMTEGCSMPLVSIQCPDDYKKKSNIFFVNCYPCSLPVVKCTFWMVFFLVNNDIIMQEIICKCVRTEKQLIQRLFFFSFLLLKAKKNQFFKSFKQVNGKTARTTVFFCVGYCMIKDCKRLLNEETIPRNF